MLGQALSNCKPDMNDESPNKQDKIITTFFAAVALGLVVAFALYIKNVNSDVEDDLLFTQETDSFLTGKGSGDVKLEDSIVDDSAQPQVPPKEETMTKKTYSSTPEMNINQNMDYKAILATNKGEITLDLFEEESPVTVNNFVFLANEGFYDGIIFHRVIKDFMIQGGDPQGTGRGGPGYSFADEINDKKIVQGSLAMANAGPNTNGSQFFIVTADATPWLDGKHTNFGQVTEGLDVVMAIQSVQTGPMDKPIEVVVIESVRIIEEPKS